MDLSLSHNFGHLRHEDCLTILSSILDLPLLTRAGSFVAFLSFYHLSIEALEWIQRYEVVSHSYAIDDDHLVGS
jgi:hypothetical protein